MYARAISYRVILKDTLWLNTCSKLTIKTRRPHGSILTFLLLTFEQSKVFQFIISQAHIENFQSTESKKKSKSLFCLLLLG